MAPTGQFNVVSTLGLVTRPWLQGHGVTVVVRLKDASDVVGLMARSLDNRVRCTVAKNNGLGADPEFHSGIDDASTPLVGIMVKWQGRRKGPKCFYVCRGDLARWRAMAASSHIGRKQRNGGWAEWRLEEGTRKGGS